MVWGKSGCQVEQQANIPIVIIGFPSASGRDIFNGEEFAFANSCLVATLPPRESRYIRFGRDFSTSENTDKHRKDKKQ